MHGIGTSAMILYGVPHTFVTHSYVTGTHGRYVRLETEDDAIVKAGHNKACMDLRYST